MSVPPLIFLFFELSKLNQTPEGMKAYVGQCMKAVPWKTTRKKEAEHCCDCKIKIGDNPRSSFVARKKPVVMASLMLQTVICDGSHLSSIVICAAVWAFLYIYVFYLPCG